MAAQGDCHAGDRRRRKACLYSGVALALLRLGRTVLVGAGSPAKHPLRGMAPALPVFAAKAAPTGCAPGLLYKPCALA
ncbi:hypothetical protein DM807_11620 [Pseudomonas hunanensis]|nr:hypothetical protein [Pseudomonas hunanensis]RNF71135.1 hypothetical protein EFJ98_11440 [Pseudomonas putida]